MTPKNIIAAQIETIIVIHVDGGVRVGSSVSIKNVNIYYRNTQL